MSDMTTNPASWFKGLGSAQATGGGNYFNPGTYLCEVVAITRRVSSDPAKRNARQILAELRVVEVLAKLPADANYGPSNTAGEVCTVYVNLDSDYPSMDMARLKGILVALFGAGAATDEAGWMDLASRVTEPPGSFAAGERLVVQASKTTTKRGKAITVTSFQAAPPAGDAP